MRFQATLAQFNADLTPEAADIPLIKGKGLSLLYTVILTHFRHLTFSNKSLFS
jgi:hypothetical protein